MAVYPCSYSNHRYRLAQQSVYWTEISEHMTNSWLLRLCPEHFDLVHEVVENSMDNVDNGSEPSEKCQLCADARTFTVQARMYPRKAEDEQWIADLCAVCAKQVAEQAHTYNGSLLRER